MPHCSPPWKIIFPFGFFLCIPQRNAACVLCTFKCLIGIPATRRSSLCDWPPHCVWRYRCTLWPWCASPDPWQRTDPAPVYGNVPDTRCSSTQSSGADTGTTWSGQTACCTVCWAPQWRYSGRPLTRWCYLGCEALRQTEKNMSVCICYEFFLFA